MPSKLDYQPTLKDPHVSVSSGRKHTNKSEVKFFNQTQVNEKDLPPPTRLIFGILKSTKELIVTLSTSPSPSTPPPLPPTIHQILLLLLPLSVSIPASGFRFDPWHAHVHIVIANNKEASIVYFKRQRCIVAAPNRSIVSQMAIVSN